MADQTKYQLFLNELLTIENQLLALFDQSKRSDETKSDLERQLQLLKKENEILKAQMETYLKELELYKSGKLGANVGDKERQFYKQKVQDAINKIDNYLESSSK